MVEPEGDCDGPPEGDGDVGVVVELEGGVAGLVEELVVTLMANFWPREQWLPTVQMK